MATDIICEISSENELICEMSSAGEIVVEVNAMTYWVPTEELAGKASVEDVALKADKTYVDTKLSEKANKQQEAWIVPTLLNGWIGLPGSANIKYRKNNFGVVEIEGVLSGGSLNTIAFILPTGYRPVGKYYIAVVNGYIEVNTAGNVIPKSGSLHNLSTISFEGV